jgi:hypothetical protein
MYSMDSSRPTSRLARLPGREPLVVRARSSRRRFARRRIAWTATAANADVFKSDCWTRRYLSESKFVDIVRQEATSRGGLVDVRNCANIAQTLLSHHWYTSPYHEQLSIDLRVSEVCQFRRSFGISRAFAGFCFGTDGWGPRDQRQ